MCGLYQSEQGMNPVSPHLPAAYNQTYRLQAVLENYLNVYILRNDMWSRSRSHFSVLLVYLFIKSDNFLANIGKVKEERRIN